MADAPSEDKKLDVANPTGAVKAFRKMFADLRDGEPTIFWWSGRLYSRVRGEKDRLLLDFEGMSIRATKTTSNQEKGYGFKLFSRELLLYKDPKTGELVHTWENPWTGSECSIIHIVNDPVNREISAEGPRGPFKFPGRIVSGRVLLSVEVPLFYPNPLGGEFQSEAGGMYHAQEMFNLFAKADDIIDASKQYINDVDIGWCRVSQWLPWMEMGDREGCLLWHGAGTRLARFDDLTPLLKETIETKLPLFKSPPPLDDSRKNETSVTYYKKVKCGEVNYPWSNK